MKNWNTTLFGLAILALQLGKPFVEPKFADVIDKLTMGSVVGGFASAADARRRKSEGKPEWAARTGRTRSAAK
jgi:hypothetical protein